MQDAANLDLILVGEAINQEVTRAANSTESLIDMITAVPKVIGAGDARDFVARGAARALGVTSPDASKRFFAARRSPPDATVTAGSLEPPRRRKC